MKREVVQHIDDIEIPTIEIADGWSVDDVLSRQDCDDAFAYLMSACAGIEYQIDMEMAKPKPWDDRWLAKARCALKFKKTALQIVNQKRGVINEADKRAWQDSRDRKLLEYIRTVVPNHQFLEWIRASGITQSTAHEDSIAA